jgi:putative hemolysin
VLIFISLASFVFALRNPSAVYCESLGYAYSTQKTNSGDLGMCKLPNGEMVEAFSFLYGETGKDYNYCKINGYLAKTVQDPVKCSGVFSAKCLVCVINNTEIEVTKLMKLSFREGKCGDGFCSFDENYDICPNDCPKAVIKDAPDTNNKPISKTDNKPIPNTEGKLFSYTIIIIVILVILFIIGIIAYKKKSNHENN